MGIRIREEAQNESVWKFIDRLGKSKRSIDDYVTKVEAFEAKLVAGIRDQRIGFRRRIKKWEKKATRNNPDRITSPEIGALLAPLNSMPPIGTLRTGDKTCPYQHIIDEIEKAVVHFEKKV